MTFFDEKPDRDIVGKVGEQFAGAIDQTLAKSERSG